MKRSFLVPVVFAAMLQSAAPAAARDHIWIVSPSAILPFTKAVAERVARAVGGPAPIVEHADTTLGIKLLCGGADAERPDAVGATRRMTKAELDACQRNGVTEVVEIPVGIDLLVIAQSKAGPPMRLTMAQAFLALAKQTPDEYGEMTPNVYKRWSEVDASLPDAEDRTSGRCNAFPARARRCRSCCSGRARRAFRASPAFGGRRAYCQKSVLEMREDHPFVVIHEIEEVIVRQLLAHPAAVGVFGYRFLQANTATLRGIPIDGIEPTPENAYAGKYPGTRALYLYLRKTDIGAVRGLDKLGAEHVSIAALGADGYLLKLGFLPLPPEDLVKGVALAKALPPVRRELLPD